MSDVESTARSTRSGKFVINPPRKETDESQATESLEEEPFTNEEIREQLEALGYSNVPDYQLRLFKADLERLIWYDQHKDVLSEEEKEGEPSDGESLKMVKLAGREDGEPSPPYSKKSTKKSSSAQWAPRRLQLCQDMGLNFDRRSPSPATTESSTVGSRCPHRWHRRKVLRHVNGIPTVCEESFTDAEPDEATDLSEQLSTTTLDESKKKSSARGRSRSYTWAPDCPIVNAIVCKKGNLPKRPATASAAIKKKKITKDDYYDEIVRYLPKAFVDNPDGIQPLKKTNPSERFNMYRKMWDQYRIPGEAPDLELRWCIRALLLTKRVPEVQTYALKKKEAIENARRMKEHKSWV